MASRRGAHRQGPRALRRDLRYTFPHQIAWMVCVCVRREAVCCAEHHERFVVVLTTGLVPRACREHRAHCWRVPQWAFASAHFLRARCMGAFPDSARIIARDIGTVRLEGVASPREAFTAARLTAGKLNEPQALGGPGIRQRLGASRACTGARNPKIDLRLKWSLHDAPPDDAAALQVTLLCPACVSDSQRTDLPGFYGAGL